jgi:hypothetical protein
VFPPASFCVALRSQPINTTVSLKPFIDFGLALEALDVAKLGARIVSLDLPLVLSDALVFEFDSGFAHAALCLLLAGGASGAARRSMGRRPTGADMTARIHENASAWPVDAAKMMPPRDPNDDDDEEEDENGDESEDEEPAVIREPDE